MGDVLTFKPLETGKQAKTGRVPGAPSRDTSAAGETAGEIVFFPGVRIERHTVDLSLRVAPRTRGSSPRGRRNPRKRS